MNPSGSDRTVPRIPTVLLALCALVALGTGGALAAPPAGTIVDIENTGDKLLFYPAVEFERMILTVTGPCGYEFRQVTKDREMVFALDERTIDGVYRFYVTREEEVDGNIVQILREARAENDAETPKALCREGLLPAPPLSQTSGFLVDRGRIIYDPEAIEDRSVAGPATVTSSLGHGAGGNGGNGGDDGGIQVVTAADFVINDDLIVDGSACIGFDCVNGEVFSFDTIRLKENNLRIKFDDTSVVPSFPANDWQLTANESANGGASKFSIEDVSGGRTPFTVEANARSHSLYVDDGGRIGSRTSTPSVEIHTIDGDTPTLRLQQDGSSGFEPQTWDVAGNETNFFVRDVTNGSTLPFRIRPSAPSNSIFIDVDGDVGLGTSSPEAALEVASTSGAFENVLKLENNSGVGFILDNTTADAVFISVNNGGTAYTVNYDDGDPAEFSLDADGNVTLSGTITTTGGTCGGGCDLVFADGYDLPTIEEHAAEMWAKGYLPNVGPTPENAPIDLGDKTGRILNELEHAHIFIAQLNTQLSESRSEFERELEAKDAELAEMKDRLARLEGLLIGSPTVD
ncbi:MAG: hypothetical protein DWQ36_07960 [Acidobacteria bacterium]|nr:MAG: hypothetical protein DWQ30_03865 [Acidobacteriota bacterium]REK08897.1 MAG: hypothetical protein DWQ36_07960 [Acidobacteriota bacterium]